MTYIYQPRGAPTRHMRTAPAAVRKAVLDIIEINPPMPFEYDVLLRPEPRSEEFAGVDFSATGIQGQHFFLTDLEARAYRKATTRKRVAWYKLPEAAKRAIERYVAQ